MLVGAGLRTVTSRHRRHLPHIVDLGPSRGTEYGSIATAAWHKSTV